MLKLQKPLGRCCLMGVLKYAGYVLSHKVLAKGKESSDTCVCQVF
jgi:hypothetical protein